MLLLLIPNTMTKVGMMHLKYLSMVGLRIMVVHIGTKKMNVTILDGIMPMQKITTPISPIGKAMIQGISGHYGKSLPMSFRRVRISIGRIMNIGKRRMRFRWSATAPKGAFSFSRIFSSLPK